MLPGVYLRNSRHPSFVLKVWRGWQSKRHDRSGSGPDDGEGTGATATSVTVIEVEFLKSELTMTNKERDELAFNMVFGRFSSRQYWRRCL